ncbi:MAG: hypothetical protein JOY54_03205 [Acidobacteriaceae bacterium]|nr:hypothetical protein [Acidobacteriaceae bacterium]
MRRLGILLVAAVFCRAADDPQQVLEEIRQKVQQQLSKSANYACTETLYRNYFLSTVPLSAACAAKSSPAQRKEFAHDRLRLDIAVSENAELYSWRGENNYSSKQIDEIVQSGPISSGGFVGYLQNIFLGKDIEFRYTGRSTANSVETFHFEYTVPKAASQYEIIMPNGRSVVPFHGSFSASAASLELVSLKVIADDIPFGSNICSAETEVTYQLLPISGRTELIPATFELSLDDDEHMFTVSRGEYSHCHEFRAESTLRFDYSDTTALPSAARSAVVERLPAGLVLKVSLATPIDEETSFTGDPVDAVLASPLKIPRTGETIPRGARLHGVITQLESRSQPGNHYFVKIVFERLTWGERSYLLRAIHKPSDKEIDHMSSPYGGVLPKSYSRQINDGVLIITAGHLHLDQRFTGDWRTTPIAAPQIATPAQ